MHLTLGYIEYIFTSITAPPRLAITQDNVCIFSEHQWLMNFELWLIRVDEGQ